MVDLVPGGGWDQVSAGGLPPSNTGKVGDGVLPSSYTGDDAYDTFKQNTEQNQSIKEQIGHDHDERIAELNKQSRGITSRKFDEPIPTPSPVLTKPFKSDITPQDPMQTFGSLASFIGLLASTLTKTPLTSAFNSAGAVMKAAKDNDVAAYAQEYKAWQENVKQASDNFKIENQRYKDAQGLFKTDQTQAYAQLRTQFAQEGSDYKTALMMAGQTDKLDELQFKTEEQFRRLDEHMNSKDVKPDSYYFNTRLQEYLHQGFSPSDAASRAGADLKVFNEESGLGKAEPGAKNYEAFKADFKVQHPEMSAADADLAARKAWVEAGKGGGEGAPETEFNKQKEADWAKTNPGKTRADIPAQERALWHQEWLTQRTNVNEGVISKEVQDVVGQIDSGLKLLASGAYVAGIPGTLTSTAEGLGLVRGDEASRFKNLEATIASRAVGLLAKRYSAKQVDDIKSALGLKDMFSSNTSARIGLQQLKATLLKEPGSFAFDAPASKMMPAGHPNAQYNDKDGEWYEHVGDDPNSGWFRIKQDDKK